MSLSCTSSLKTVPFFNKAGNGVDMLLSSHFCSPGIYTKRLAGALGRPTDRSQPTPRGGPLPPPLYRSVHRPAKLVEAQLPPIGDEPNFLLSTRNGHSWSREEVQLPPPYRCVYDPGGKFSLANKNPGVHGADF